MDKSTDCRDLVWLWRRLHWFGAVLSSTALLLAWRSSHATAPSQPNEGKILSATASTSVTLKGHAKGINCMAYAPSGKMLATASNDRTARVWALPAGKPVANLKHDRQVSA